MVGYPSISNLKNMIKNIFFKAYYPGGHKISQDIHSPNISDLKGKTTITKPLQVNLDIIKIPETIKNMHRNLTLYFDIFFVNKIQF